MLSINAPRPFGDRNKPKSPLEISPLIHLVFFLYLPLQQVDVLLYMALGNTLGNHLLALGRLAPIQVTPSVKDYGPWFSLPAYYNAHSAYQLLSYVRILLKIAESLE